MGGGYWAHKYDIYVGTDPAVLTLVAADVTWLGRQAGPNYVEDYVVGGLAGGVKYYWKVVGKTMADKVKASVVRSFTTATGLPPSVNGVSPNSGPTQGGTSVTISGSGFATGASVSIGGVPASTVSVANANTIVAITPAHAAGAANVMITNPDNQSGSLVNAYTYIAPNLPPQVSINASQTIGSIPLLVNFTSTASDPDGSIVGYSWDFGNGQSSTQAAPTYTYLTEGTFNARLTVTDNRGATAQASIPITATGASSTSQLKDDFADNVIDLTKWRVNKLDIAAADPAVSVKEQNQRAEFTPLINTTGSHTNGFSSVKRYDLTNQQATVQVVQAANTTSSANTCFLLINGSNWYRFLIENGTLYFQQFVNGSLTKASIAYNQADHQYWRIRHDAGSDTILWETSSDSSNWTTRRSQPRQFALTTMRLELYVRTWKAESAPGVVKFDNVRIGS
ncbi:MAG: PKD domain-containing protein [Pyrinomonadaceae bacterium]